MGANGLIYLGSNDGHLYVLTPGGQAQAQLQVDGGIDFASPALGADGTLYVATRGGALYALKEGAPAPGRPLGAWLSRWPASRGRRSAG